MKRLFRTTLIYYLSIIIFSGCGKTKNPNDMDDSIDLIVNETFAEDPISSSSEFIEREERPEYRGNFIMKHDNIKVYAKYGLWEDESKYGDDITAKDETYLIRYVNEIPKDSMVLKGPHNSLLGKGCWCKITVGTDTVNVNITRPFNKYLDLRFIGVLPGCRFYRFSRHYTLSQRSFPTDFQINIAIQEDAPEYIRDYINEKIRDDIAGYFGDYSGDKIIYPQIPLYNIMNGNFAQLSRYYYNQFRRLYKKENSCEDDNDNIPSGPHYSYQFYAYPVWANSDSTLITWKFYDYCYMGGAHGGENEYYLTFNNGTGRILGIDDFYTSYEFNKAMDVLKHQLNAYHNRNAYDECSISAALDDDSNIRAMNNTILNEAVGGKLYPRPALTRQGIVFTYQTYEKGSNADGILHFTQSYKPDYKLK